MTDLTRYAYDARSGAYVGKTQAHPDPIEADRLLEPAFSTALAPPDLPAKQIAIFSAEGWAVEADHRGETWFKGVEAVLIAAPGDPAAAGLTAEPVLPPTPPATSCSKLGLKRAFSELGIWPQVRALIASDPDMQEEWELATELHVADPLVQKAIAGLAAINLSMTDDQVLKLVARANELARPAAA